ncbi:MAG: hypothetical protein V3T95_03465 [Acidobacteriota bacterium]
MALNRELLGKLEERVRMAETLIRNLREENHRLQEQLDEMESATLGTEIGNGVPLMQVETLLEERASVRTSINRMLNLLDRMSH